MIYFIQAVIGGPIKIGYTDDVAERLRHLQCGSPYPLVVLDAIKGGEEKEDELHAEFKADRLHGEWFRPSPEMLRYIKIPSSDRTRVLKEVPRLALTVGEAAASLGVSGDFFHEHIAPDLCWVRRGRMKLVATTELERWLADGAAVTLPRVAA